MDEKADAVSGRVRAALAQIAAEEQVRVLFAVESGSRAWGFASPDSDFDIRFVFVRPVARYLALRPDRDVIERPLRDELDIAGWDLRKALNLLLKPNPVLLEWLGSPIRYLWEDPAAQRLAQLAAETEHVRACTAHYARLAKGAWEDHVAGRETVSLKGYLYVARASLCVGWIVARRVGPPPVRLRALLAAGMADPETCAEIAALMAEKSAAGEGATGRRRPRLDRYYRAMQDRGRVLPPGPRPDSLAERADRLFREVVLG
ncbi:MAG: nucleotidyltransferase domain-containing protein [Rhodobacteraceae bacterium]|nr:nucleotidyltransferase domain-containing protein [Paracoccaceae bacterium]